MNSIYQNRKKSIWSVVTKDGSYVAQVTEANSRARCEGWRVVGTNLTLSEACEMRDNLKVSAFTITPDLSDLFIYDYAEPVETRALDGVQEYDVILAQCTDGIWRTGSVISWNSRTVRIEVGNVIYRARVKTAELVVKADDANWGDDEPEVWTVEYDEYLDETEEPYEIQTPTGVAA